MLYLREELPGIRDTPGALVFPGILAILTPPFPEFQWDAEFALRFDGAESLFFSFTLWLFNGR